MLEPQDNAEERAAMLIRAATKGAPPLKQDQIAAMLGLVPDEDLQLDSGALKRALKSATMKPSQLASALAARGWRIAARDVLDWMGGNAAGVSPALISGIANAIGIPSDRLTSGKSRTTSRSLAERISDRLEFEKLAERFAVVRGVPRAIATSSLRSAVSAMAFRGGAPDEDAALAALEDMVRALESREA